MCLVHITACPQHLSKGQPSNMRVTVDATSPGLTMSPRALLPLMREGERFCSGCKISIFLDDFQKPHHFCCDAKAAHVASSPLGGPLPGRSAALSGHYRQRTLYNAEFTL